MANEIIDLQDWFQTPPGRYLLAWEQSQMDALVSDLFGFYALQLGLPDLLALRANRMPHRWLVQSQPVDGGPVADLFSDFSNLPLASASVDLVVLPHTLELHPDPHATLREVERVLVPEGRVVITGLNPLSLWGFRQLRAHVYRRMGWGRPYLPLSGEFMGYWRVRDWLRLLGFEVEETRFGCYRAAVRSQAWLDRLGWMDVWGARSWPFLGAGFALAATKRVHAMRLTGLVRRHLPPRVAAAPVSVAGQVHSIRGGGPFVEENKVESR